MKNLDYREYYRRNLPHIQPRGTAFLVNFRLTGSLSSEIIQKFKSEADELEKSLSKIDDVEEKCRIKDREQRRLFGKWDDALHQSSSNLLYLKDDKVAEIVAASIRHHDGEWFDVEAYCIMPNHVHLVLTPYDSSETEDYGLAKIMHNIKRNSAYQANQFLGKTGGFWQHENYDHFARDQKELERIVNYVIYNPVKAGLVQNWRDWKWTYSKYNT